jgi:hydrogenase maturation factor
MTSCRHEPGCITCGDVAVEMRILRVDAERELALCADAAGRRETVETALVGTVAPGEELLVHAGTALQRVGGRREASRA